MAVYRLKVIRKGTIIVDDVDSLEAAKEYIESCNPIDDVNWSDFLEAMDGGIELQKISIPDSMAIREFADKINVRPAEIIKWLFLRGKVANFKSVIGFDDMKEFADQYGFICEKEGDIGMRDFYYWLQRELEQELNRIYKKIHRIGVFGDKFYIWFLNNDDSISIPLNIMQNIYTGGKSIKELSAIIDDAYLAKIKK